MNILKLLICINYLPAEPNSSNNNIKITVQSTNYYKIKLFKIFIWFSKQNII
jgi:hypothetical protein